MVIDEIKKQKNNRDRFNLYSSGQFIGALNPETIVKYGIKEGISLPDGAFEDIMREDNEKYAFDKALQYISYCARTESEVIKHLKDRQMNDNIINSTIIKLKSYNYIDDIDYAEQYLHSLINSKKLGRRAAEYRLKQKGISKEIISSALEGYDKNSERENAEELYSILALKYKNDAPDKRNAKITRNMAAKGFDYDIIKALIHKRED